MSRLGTPIRITTKTMGPCPICGQAPAAEIINYNGHGHNTPACSKKAHQATARDRAEFKKFKSQG